MKWFATLNWEALSAEGCPISFLTLTTPPEFWADELRTYRGLRRFGDWLRGQVGFQFCVVRKERGARRGMLHYHLIVFGCAFRAERGSVGRVASAWAKALRLERVRVDVEEPQDAQAVAKYLSKYCSKAGYDGAELQAAAAGAAQGAGATAPASAAAASLGEVGGADTVSPPPQLATGAAGAPPLSEAHNVDSPYTGGRWWYVWGTPVYSEVEQIEGVPNIRKLANRVRRVFRRWRVKARERAMRAAVERQHGLGVAAAINWRKEMKRWGRVGARRRRREKAAGLSPGGGFLTGRAGWSLFASPEVIALCLDAGAYADA